MSTSTISSQQLGFNREQIYPAALKVVATLQQAGYDGYLVGGCVRDLILGQRPKDFDVVTNATPEQVRGLFARARVIGRRFKLVHVRVGWHSSLDVVEVATYRGHSGHSTYRDGGKKSTWFNQSAARGGRILSDNVFGNIEQDAVRRDFSINALYYDPQKEQVLDFVGGLADAQQQRLKIIGDLGRRFSEDPVRMLRLLRFQAKLGWPLDLELQRGLAQYGHLLDDIPPARLYDEVLKLFHHAHAVASWEALRQHGMLQRLFPPLVPIIQATNTVPRDTERLILLALENTDQRVLQGKPVIAAFLLGAILWSPFQRQWQTLAATRKRSSSIPYNQIAWLAGEQVFRQLSTRVGVMRRVSTQAIEIWEMQATLEQRQPTAIRRLLAHRRFRAAYDFLYLRGRVGQVAMETVEWWSEIQTLPDKQQESLIGRLPAAPNRSRRRRSGRLPNSCAARVDSGLSG